MKINFIPESDNPEFVVAAKAFAEVWQTQGQAITTEIEKVSGMKFADNEIDATIIAGHSYSHPLQLRASLTEDQRPYTLVHELCHIMCRGRVKRSDDVGSKTLAAHKTINLILYEVLANLYGQAVADREVEIESEISPDYAEAWRWAMAMTPDERRQKFASLKRD